MGQTGEVLVQDELGFSEYSPIYFSTQYMQLLRSTGVFSVPESYSLRGQVGQHRGDELMYSVAELRFPVMENIPLEILMFGLKNVTAALFYDFGYIPETETKLATWGGEFKFDLTLKEMPLVTLAWGWGGDASYWAGSDDLGNEDFLSRSYLRMALVNPF